MGWTLGSESRERTGSGEVPAGIGHAVDTASGETACGRPYRSLHPWPDIPWQRVRMIGTETCPDCDQNAG